MKAPAKLNGPSKSEANPSLPKGGPHVTRAKFSYGISLMTRSRVNWYRRGDTPLVVNVKRQLTVAIDWTRALTLYSILVAQSQ